MLLHEYMHHNETLMTRKPWSAPEEASLMAPSGRHWNSRHFTAAPCLSCGPASHTCTPTLHASAAARSQQCHKDTVWQVCHRVHGRGLRRVTDHTSPHHLNIPAPGLIGCKHQVHAPPGLARTRTPRHRHTGCHHGRSWLLPRSTPACARQCGQIRVAVNVPAPDRRCPRRHSRPRTSRAAHPHTPPPARQAQRQTAPVRTPPQ